MFRPAPMLKSVQITISLKKALIEKKKYPFVFTTQDYSWVSGQRSISDALALQRNSYLLTRQRPISVKGMSLATQKNVHVTTLVLHF